MGFQINIGRKATLILVAIIFFMSFGFNLYRNKVINIWIDEVNSYTSSIFDLTNSIGEYVEYEDIVNKANEILNTEKLDEIITFFENNISKKSIASISKVNGFYYQYISNFKEGIHLLAIGDIQGGFKNINNALQNINDTTMLANETMEKINSGTNNNSDFQFLIGF